VTQVNAIDKDGTFPNNQVRNSSVSILMIWSELTYLWYKGNFLLLWFSYYPVWPHETGFRAVTDMKA
jgi:hypothetical protein